MKFKALVSVAKTILGMCSLSLAASSQVRWDAPKVVTRYCSGCHGIAGESQLPYFPKISALSTKYAEKKLAAFKEPKSPQVDELYGLIASTFSKDASASATREERINMEGVAHAASPNELSQALEWYSQQPPPIGYPGNKALMEKGREIFTKGVAAQKVLPCMTCHGPNAEGQGSVPRLAGQNAKYIEGQLEKFRKGDRRHAPEMTMVTRDLDAQQAREAAAYLQSK